MIDRFLGNLPNHLKKLGAQKTYSDSFKISGHKVR